MSNLIAEEEAYTAIKQMIIQTQLKPGARLVHRTLAKELGMSAIPIVLALRLLERDGLVVNMPGMGAYVRTWNRDEIIDLYHIRASQEALAARLCAERATRVDMASILDAKEGYEKALEEGEFEAIVQADAAFHLSMVRGAHCAYLETMISNLSIVNLSIHMSHFYLKAQKPTFPNAPIWIHVPIVDALEKKDAAAASAAAKEHIEASLRLKLELFDESAEGLPKAEEARS